MKNLNCEMFELTILFDEKNFKSKDFRTSKSKDKSHKLFVSHHNSGNARKKEHSHLAIILDKKDSYLKAMFLEESLEENRDIDELSDIPLDECIKDISPFFKKDEFKVSLHAIFRFNRNYEPIIKIRYPLLVENNLLRNAEISGHEITFSNESMEGAFLMTANGDDSITTLFSAKTSIALSKFNPYTEIERAVSYVQSLLKRKGKKDNEKNNS